MQKTEPSATATLRHSRSPLPSRLARSVGGAAALAALVGLGPPPAEPDQRLILQGAYAERMTRAVVAAGGRVTHDLPAIGGLAATVPAWGVTQLATSSAVHRLWPDRSVAGALEERPWRSPPDIEPRWEVQAVRADRLHAAGLTGRGVTIALVDGGLPPPPPAADGHRRLLARYDAVRDVELPAAAACAAPGGHATQLLSVLLSGEAAGERAYQGVAPNADLVLVDALGVDGSGRVADVVRGIGWVIDNRERYGIRVLNLSLASPPHGPYWDDPLGEAVMSAWAAGLVVVAAAGNGGPGLESIASPGNVPYAITVGATAAVGMPKPPTGGALATYSAAGPTAAGFVKPEVLAPSGRPPADERTSTAAGTELRHVAAGTSLAAAVVSGVVALVLERSPWLGPNRVKHRLLATARPGVDQSGLPAYSVLRQGAGLVDAWQATLSDSEEAANRGLDVHLDLAGEAHYRGRPRRLADGSIEVTVVAVQEPDAEPAGPLGYTWSDGRVAVTGLIDPEQEVAPPSRGFIWSEAAAGWGLTWSDGLLEGDGPQPAGLLWSD